MLGEAWREERDTSWASEDPSRLPGAKGTKWGQHFLLLPGLEPQPGLEREEVLWALGGRPQDAHCSMVSKNETSGFT